MAKSEPVFWLLVVEPGNVTKHGPYFEEKEIDDDAKRIFQEMMKKDPKRLQKMQCMMVVRPISKDDFEVELYEPKFMVT
jgi:hypothetical protein